MLPVLVALSHCRRTVLAVLGCVALLGAPAPVAAQAAGQEHTAADVVTAFYRAVCAHDDATTLALLVPGAPIIYAAWTPAGQGHRVATLTLNRPGTERPLLDYLRLSACLPLDNLQAEGDIATWQQTLWQDETEADSGKTTVRWHARARIEERQIADLRLALEVPSSGLPPPPLPLTTTGGITSTAGATPATRGPQARPAPLAGHPPVSIAVGPTEAGWPVLVLGVVGLAGLVLLGGLAGRTRRRARSTKPTRSSRTVTCIWLSVGLLSGLLVGLAPPAAAQVSVQEAVPVVQALQRLLGIQDDRSAVPLFHADAVIEIEGPSGQELYAGRGPDSLLDGIRKLAESRPSLDLATAQVSGATFSGAPATRVLCAYRGSPGPLNLPPERGQDDIRIQSGRIVYYTRRPDFRSLAAREAARPAANSAFGTRVAVATTAAASGIYDRTPDTQERTSPAVGQVIALVAIPLAVVVMLAMFRRPSTPA